MIAVRGLDTRAILAQLETRTQNGRDAEIARALEEIATIARLRLQGAVTP